MRTAVRRRAIGPVLLLGILAGCATKPVGRSMISYDELSGAPAPAGGERIVYGSDPLQFGVLRLPSGTKSAPVVVLMHGGCWRSAFDLGYMAHAAAALTAAGYATWTIEFRRLGDAGGGWPGTFADVAMATDHVRALATAHARLDTTRVVLAGHSAGGQLALWSASRAADRSHDELPSGATPLRVSGVVSLSGITDLADYGRRPGACNSAVTPLMGGTPAEQRARYRAVSPAERIPIGVPMRLVHGGEDTIVPVEQVRRFTDQARAAGDRVVLDVVAGAGHFDLVAPQSIAWATVIGAVRALVPTP